MPAATATTDAPVRRSPVVKYPKHSPLRAELVRRVDAYFEETGTSRSGGWRIALKAVVILSWYVGSWVFLVFAAVTWWQVLLGTLSIGLAAAGVGFAVQHDGGHGASSQRKLGNRLAAYGLDLLGGSSYVWSFKHNIIHHQFTNVDGVDDDLEAEPFLRMTEGQSHHWFHRFQHLYFWMAYAWLPPKWHFWDDFASVITGRVGSQTIPRPKGFDLFALFGFKAFFITFAFVIPLMLHPWWAVLGVYAVASAVIGITLATVFQLAHCLEEAEFVPIPAEGERLERPWAEHQLATTVDFAPHNTFLTWYLGGLNYQVEHHLFPGISHVHYPAIRRIVESVCAEAGVEHKSNPTFLGALASHRRYLKRMGRAVAPAAAA